MNPDLERLLDNYGTATASHTGRTLRDHLIGTFKLLHVWGNHHDVCVAGLFHSIYGTEVYTLSSAGLGERDTIRRAIGERAEELAYLFCACDRRHLLANVDKADGFILRDRSTERDVALDRGALAALVEIAFAKTLHPDGLELHTHQENHAARQLYERHGFRAVKFGLSPPPENAPDVEYHWRPDDLQ